MPGSVDVNSTTQQTTRQDSTAAQTLGAFRFGDNNFGTGSGSAGAGGGLLSGLTPITALILVVAVLGGIYLWKRR